MLSLNEARRIIRAAEDEAARLGCAVNIAVLDDSGHVIAQVRMDGAWLAGVNDALNKAYTACAFAIETKDLAGFARTAEERAGGSFSNDRRIVATAGGIPLRRYGRIIGAIGVSGGRECDSEVIAETGARAFTGECVSTARRSYLSSDPAAHWDTPSQISRFGSRSSFWPQPYNQSTL